MVIYLISSFMDFRTAAVRRGALILHAGNHRTYRVVWFYYSVFPTQLQEGKFIFLIFTLFILQSF